MKWLIIILIALAGCDSSNPAARFEAEAYGCDYRWFHYGDCDTMLNIPRSEFVVTASDAATTVVCVGGKYGDRTWAVEMKLDGDSPVERYRGVQHYEQIRRVVILRDGAKSTVRLAWNGEVNNWDKRGLE
jgi:hypothetical protein